LKALRSSRGSSIAGAFLAASLVLAASPWAAQAAHRPRPAPRYGGVLNTALPVDPGTMDPRLISNTSTQAIDSLVFDGLVHLGNNLVPQPALAVSWKQLSPKVWLFHLRHGVKFQNGQPFTSTDVAYTYNTLLQPSFKAPQIALYQPIRRVVTDGPYAVKFILSEPYAPLLSYLNLGIVPHVAAAKPGFGLHPIGTGPYSFVSYSVNNETVLKANPDYWGGKPYIQEIVFKVIPDNTTQVLGLESGSLNFITSPLPYPYVLQLEKNPKYHVMRITGLGTLYLNMNLRDPIISDLKVREAIQYALNRTAITQHIYDGVHTPAYTQLIPNTWWWDPAVKGPAYSLSKARAVLKSDGWKPGPGGYLEKDGKTLSISLTTYNDPTRVQVLEYLQQSLKQIGIKATVTQYEWPTFIGNVMAGKYQVAMIGWLDLVDPDRAFYAQFVTGQVDNWEHYSNPTVDKLLTEARQISNTAQRKALYVRAAKIILSQLPYIEIADQGYVVMTAADVHGYQIDRTGSLRGLDKAWIG
jgi:peptide/nickel transport system substrate-binding protein